MNKQEFLARLRKRLSGLPQNDIDERLAFYSEMIADRMEEGLLEEEAVAEIVSADEIAALAAADIPTDKNEKENSKGQRRLSAAETVLLALGSPLWLSLLIAGFAVILALFISGWAVVISVWAVFASLAVSAFACLAASAVVFLSDALGAAALFAAGLVCAGFGIFIFYGAKAAAKGLMLCTKKSALWIKNHFVRKGNDA